ncbi:MAG: lipopolysaccharide kinase InaA family protein [Azoarcus sp.]|jgi:hypothetical protein|nr:lipopolysaccharide kinase InaA family protein [Azoarcus sp.]
MKDFISPADRAILERHGLAGFDALWHLRLTSVDAPNENRGGWSQVCRLDLDGQGYYLKRQCNHLTRGLAHPGGEPTFAREFRNIRRFRAQGVPTLHAAFFARRRLPGEIAGRRDDCAILLTRALDGWRAMGEWLAGWASLAGETRARLLVACGEIARRLHACGLIHACFYPKHVFLRETAEGFEATLIDLEKVRFAWLGRRDRCRDLEQFFRHAAALSSREIDIMLAAYLADTPESAAVAAWRQYLAERRKKKDGGV